MRMLKTREGYMTVMDREAIYNMKIRIRNLCIEEIEHEFIVNQELTEGNVVITNFHYKGKAYFSYFKSKNGVIRNESHTRVALHDVARKLISGKIDKL